MQRLRETKLHITFKTISQILMEWSKCFIHCSNIKLDKMFWNVHFSPHYGLTLYLSWDSDWCRHRFYKGCWALHQIDTHCEPSLSGKVDGMISYSKNPHRQTHIDLLSHNITNNELNTWRVSNVFWNVAAIVSMEILCNAIWCTTEYWNLPLI